MFIKLTLDAEKENFLEVDRSEAILVDGGLIVSVLRHSDDSIMVCG